VSDASLAAADTVAPADLHATFVRAFADYLIGPFQIPLDQWPAFLARQAVDLGASRVAIAGGRVIAFAFAAPRPAIGRWRLAVMGALPESRGGGAAPALLDDFVDRAHAQGVQAVELECIEQNARARRLYLGRGFEVVQALHGWTAQPRGPGDAAREEALPAPVRHEVDREAAFAWLDDATRAIPNLPLQVTGPSLRAAARPLTCWRSGSAQLIFSVQGDTPIQVHSLVDPAPGQRDAQALVRALRAAWPDLAISVPALQRDDLGGEALRREGFEMQAMNQVLMVRAARP